MEKIRSFNEPQKAQLIGSTSVAHLGKTKKVKSRDFFRLTRRLGLIQLQLLFILQTAFAGSATWQLNPVSGDWNTAANWTPPTITNGSADTATFDVSNQTSLTLSANTEVNGIVFNAGASAFTIALSGGLTLTLSGTGITKQLRHHPKLHRDRRGHRL